MITNSQKTVSIDVSIIIYCFKAFNVPKTKNFQFESLKIVCKQTCIKVREKIMKFSSCLSLDFKELN